MKHQTLVILDFGSQYTQLIARRVRELGVYSVILPASSTLEKIQSHDPHAVVLSGGPSSVYDPGAPGLPHGFLEWQMSTLTPVLGICYGMQLLAHVMGGKVESAKTREYGRMAVLPRGEGTRSSVLPVQRFFAWMSHGDEIVKEPPGFVRTAQSESGTAAAMENADRRIVALQFHPEVTHTEQGSAILEAFLFKVAPFTRDWSMKSVQKELIQKIQAQVGSTSHILCALSGGVDSAVGAVLAHRAIGDRLHCVFVDNGLLRLDEQARVMRLFKKELHLPVTCVDASQRFLIQLKGVTDPEAKRKIIGTEFIRVFEESAKLVGNKIGNAPEYLLQGTLYPDVIESSPGHLHSTTIKSHHNVGGLPREMKFKLVEPLRELFKDEVRALGAELGVSPEFLKRHPFPGPGLAVRVIGEIEESNLEVLRKADEIWIECLREAGLYDQIWQAFAVFLPIRTVGVKGDGRSHDHVIALRAVTSRDGMTADWYRFEPEVLARASNRICNEVVGVSRVVYDVSSKPPATIEWE